MQYNEPIPTGDVATRLKVVFTIPQATKDQLLAEWNAERPPADAPATKFLELQKDACGIVFADHGYIDVAATKTSEKPMRIFLEDIKVHDVKFANGSIPGLTDNENREVIEEILASRARTGYMNATHHLGLLEQVEAINDRRVGQDVGNRRGGAQEHSVGMPA